MRYLFIMLIIPVMLFSEYKDYVILHARPGAGMFSIWMDVLSLLNEYDKGNYSGVEVNLDGGAYLDPNHGTNWWEYYCESIRLGKRNDPKDCVGNPPGSLGCIENNLTRQQAKRLIDKYIQIKPHILKKITQIQREFYGYVVCVHYRGTDKYTEAPAVSYQTMRLEIEKATKEYLNFRIFVATDEQTFINYMILFYGDKVLYNKNALRAVDFEPLHHGKYDKYQTGEDAVIDAVLLSRGDLLIRTSSNLSRWSTWFNPHIPIIEMNQPGF